MVIEVPTKVLNSDKLNVNNTLFFFSTSYGMIYSESFRFRSPVLVYTLQRCFFIVISGRHFFEQKDPCNIYFEFQKPSSGRIFQ